MTGRDIGDFEAEVRSRIAAEVKLSPGNYLVFSGAAQAQAQAREDLIVHSLIAAIGIFLLLYIAFNNLRNLLITFVNLPFALIGGVIGSLLTGGVLSLGSLVGFVTVLGIAARNGIMLVSHYRHLEVEEGLPFGLNLVIQGSLERLAPIMMTALATGLALVPLVIAGDKPGHEIEHPMAVVILGGLVTSTVLNLFIMPSLYLAFGRSSERSSVN